MTVHSTVVLPRRSPRFSTFQIECTVTVICVIWSRRVQADQRGRRKGRARPRNPLPRALSQPHIAEHLRQRVLRYLAIQAARAGAVKGELLDCSDEMVRGRPSSIVLRCAGIQPDSNPSISVNLNIRAGYVIDLSDDPPAMRTIPHI